MNIVASYAASSWTSSFSPKREEGGERMRADAAHGSDSVRTLQPGPPEDLAVITEIASNWRAKSDSETVKADESAESVAGPTPEDRARNQAKEKVQRLIEEFKLIKKFWAHDPKEMAHQLGRLASELKDALSEYVKAAKATRDKMGGPIMGGAALGMAVPSSAPAQAEQADTRGEADAASDALQDETHAVDAEADTDAALQDDAAQHDTSAAQARAKLAAAYGVKDVAMVRADQTPMAMQLRGDMEFIMQVRAFASLMKDELNDARDRAIFTVPGKAEKSEEFVEADKAFKALNKDLVDFERDTRKLMPPAGMMVAQTG